MPNDIDGQQDANDDDELAAMLHDLNGTSPAPDLVEEEAQNAAKMQEQAPEAAEDKEPISTIKLTAHDPLTKNIVPVDKGSASKPDPEPAPAKEAADELVVPNKFKSLLNDRDRKLLMENPALASRLLRVFASSTQIREVRNRAFIPLENEITLGDLPSIERAGWLWRDFTSSEDQTTFTHRGSHGFLASTQLSQIGCRLTGADWHPKCLQTLPAERFDSIVSLARMFSAAAVAEPSHGDAVLSIPFWVRDKVVSERQVDLETAEDAICYGLEAVRVGRVRKFFFETSRRPDPHIVG